MKISNMLGRVIIQITSGRWLITFASTLCLLWLTKTLCVLMEQGKIALENSTYVAIVMSVLNMIGTISIFYFQKHREVNPYNVTQNPDDTPDDSNDSGKKEDAKGEYAKVGAK